MAYLDSTHFSDKLSYRKHFIPSYGAKDMNFAICAYLQQFSVKQIKKDGILLTETKSSQGAGRRGQGEGLGADWVSCCCSG
jgi:hypothetical protein